MGVNWGDVPDAERPAYPAQLAEEVSVPPEFAVEGVGLDVLGGLGGSAAGFPGTVDRVFRSAEDSEIDPSYQSPGQMDVGHVAVVR